MHKMLFFWGANAIEASATVSRCFFSNEITLEPAGEFAFLLAIQMVGSFLYAKIFKKDIHTVNTVSEFIVLLLTAANWVAHQLH